MTFWKINVISYLFLKPLKCTRETLKPSLRFQPFLLRGLLSLITRGCKVIL